MFQKHLFLVYFTLNFALFFNLMQFYDYTKESALEIKMCYL